MTENEKRMQSVWSKIAATIHAFLLLAVGVVLKLNVDLAREVSANTEQIKANLEASRRLSQEVDWLKDRVIQHLERNHQLGDTPSDEEGFASEPPPAGPPMPPLGG